MQQGTQGPYLHKEVRCRDLDASDPNNGDGLKGNSDDHLITERSISDFLSPLCHTVTTPVATNYSFGE